MPAALPLPRVSVALATYNGAPFVRVQLDSLAAQTLLPDELVVSDDGSTDNTLAIVRDFAATAPFPVRIVDKPERLGFSDNFLFAVAQCRHDIVALCDQDDAWLPGKLRAGVERLVADDTFLSIHRSILTDGALKPVDVWDQGIAGDRVWRPLELDPWAAWGNTMVFRRCLAAVIPAGERPRQPEASRLLTHDAWLYILAAALGGVSHIAEPLILYRQHGGNALGMVKPGMRARLRTAATVPVESYRERDIFFGALASNFDALAGRSDDVAIARNARAAAVRYRAKQANARLRARVHDAARLPARLSAFWHLYGPRRDGRDDPALRPAAASVAKDVLLGLSGWGRHV